MDDKQMTEQVSLAINFMEKLYYETSYLIKEVEGLLETEGFSMLKGKGYSISTRHSDSLNDVSFWLLKKFSVSFAPKDKREVKGGVTKTKIDNELKILYLRIVLSEKNQKSPKILFGVLSKIERKSDKYHRKFEDLMGHFEYVDSKLFSKPQETKYEDNYVKFNKKFIVVDLLEIENTEEIKKKLIEPILKIFNSP